MTQPGIQPHESGFVNIFLVTHGYSAQKQVNSWPKRNTIFVDYFNLQSEIWSGW